MKLLSKEAAGIALASVAALGLLYWAFRSKSGGSSVDYPMHEAEEGGLGQSRVDYYKSQIINVKKIDTKCTLLAPTYRRLRMLPVFLDNYCNMTDSLDGVVMVWNDIENDIPESILKLKDKCKIPLKFIRMKTNKLSNRFLPGEYLKEISSECVFVVDDDIFVSAKDMSFGLSAWQIFRKQMVGFEGRSKSFSILRDGSYNYHDANKPGMLMRPKKGYYGIMLPAFYMHKAYLEMLFDPKMVPRDMLDYTDLKFNCEDILLTMMITRFLKDAKLAWNGGLTVEPKEKIRILDLWGEKEHHGLVRRPGHMTIRSGCLNMFVKHFGKESLVLTGVVLKEGSEWAEHYYREQELKQNS